MHFFTQNHGEKAKKNVELSNFPDFGILQENCTGFLIKVAKLIKSVTFRFVK